MSSKFCPETSDELCVQYEELEGDQLTQSEWKQLKKIRKIPESFKITTLATESTDNFLTIVLPPVGYLLNTYSGVLIQ